MDLCEAPSLFSAKSGGEGREEGLLGRVERCGSRNAINCERKCYLFGNLARLKEQLHKFL